jgi:AraC family transcriptional regulator
MRFDNYDASNGSWSEVRWRMPLHSAPEVVAVGVSVHGLHGPERYLLPDFWCLHLYSYDAALRLGDAWFPIRPGFAGIIPPDTPMEYDYRGPSQHLYAHFRFPPREAVLEFGATANIPAMQDLGADFAAMYGRLEQIVLAARQPAFRAAARVWDVLCDLADRGEHVGNPVEPLAHPAVRHAVSQIETNLSSEIRVARLAEQGGVSYGYLSRLFRSAYGTSVVEYIRARRMERAAHLLKYSNLSIKAIAGSVGIPDLHLFNKTIRRSLGAPPRALRKESAAGPRNPYVLR